MSFTVGSLFDGSGGFPLAAFLSGGAPVWASEIEPYPIAVTKSRFPHMKHLGNVSEVKGNEVEPVDVIVFGFPCQDLSVAGARAGLKHEENGDGETTRSGLFFEAVRIIKEMRDATNGLYPTFACFENVPGLFSSGKGEDFRIVLEELAKIVEPSATMPTVPPFGWPHADSYVGDGWSLAYRVFDAQYWGVPQRRKRVYALLDLRGERARKILFERESVRGYFEEGRTPWKNSPADAERSVVTTDCERNSVVFDARGNGEGDIAPTITGDHNNRVTDYTSVLVEPFCKSARARTPEDATTWKHADVANCLNTFDMSEARVNEVVVCCIDGDKIGKAERAGGSGLGIGSGDTMYTLTAKDVHALCCEETPIVLDRAFFNQGANAQYEPQCYEDGTVPTLVARGPSAVSYCIGNGQVHDAMCPDEELSKTLNCMQDPMKVMVSETKPEPHYIVRRLTPTECCRLQGFPDGWGTPDKKEEFNDLEYHFWLDVRNTHAAINGRTVKNYTREQMLKWYNKLHTDSAEYKMWGNGIALPNALYMMQGIAEELN